MHRWASASMDLRQCYGADLHARESYGFSRQAGSVAKMRPAAKAPQSTPPQQRRQGYGFEAARFRVWPHCPTACEPVMYHGQSAFLCGCRASTRSSTRKPSKPAAFRLEAAAAASRRRRRHPPDPPQRPLEPRDFRIRPATSPACAAKRGADFIVNDRADFAMLLEAGLHVGQDDLPPRDARKLMGPDALHRLLQPQSRANSAPLPASRSIMWRSARSSHRVQAQPRPGGRRRGSRAAAAPSSTSRWWPSAASRAKMRRDVLHAGADSVAVIGGLLPETCTGPIPAPTDGRMATTREELARATASSKVSA